MLLLLSRQTVIWKMGLAFPGLRWKSLLGIKQVGRHRVNVGRVVKASEFDFFSLLLVVEAK